MTNSERARLSIQDAYVRDNRREDFQELIQHLFNRRSLATLDLWDQLRHGAEINAFLRSRSDVYRALSTEKEGPFLFGLGFLQLQGDEVVVVASEIPAPAPEPLCRVLSEFVEEGATLTFMKAGETLTFYIAGHDNVKHVSG